MSNLLHWLNQGMTELVRKINFNPSSYLFMFPTTVDSETIMGLVDQNFFPVLTDLAPALTYAILLGAVRFLLQRFIFKVRFPVLTCSFACEKYLNELLLCSRWL
jgi:hypothetical protein